MKMVAYDVKFTIEPDIFFLFNKLRDVRALRRYQNVFGKTFDGFVISKLVAAIKRFGRIGKNFDYQTRINEKFLSS